MVTTNTALRRRGLPEMSQSKVTVVSNVIDCAVNNQGVGDIVQLFDVPAKHLVKNLTWEVETVEGGAATFDIGDATNPDGFVDGADANVLASGLAAAAGFSGEQYYSAADTVDITFVAACDACKIRVSALVADLS